MKMKELNVHNNKLFICKYTNCVYEIIGYEIDSYLSAGTIKLNTKVGA